MGRTNLKFVVRLRAREDKFKICRTAAREGGQIQDLSYDWARGRTNLKFVVRLGADAARCAANNSLTIFCSGGANARFSVMIRLSSSECGRAFFNARVRAKSRCNQIDIGKRASSTSILLLNGDANLYNSCVKRTLALRRIFWGAKLVGCLHSFLQG